MTEAQWVKEQHELGFGAKQEPDDVYFPIGFSWLLWAGLGGGGGGSDSGGEE